MTRMLLIDPGGSAARSTGPWAPASVRLAIGPTVAVASTTRTATAPSVILRLSSVIDDLRERRVGERAPGIKENKFNILPPQSPLSAWHLCSLSMNVQQLRYLV